MKMLMSQCPRGVPCVACATHIRPQDVPALQHGFGCRFRMEAAIVKFSDAPQVEQVDVPTSSRAA